MNEVKKREHKWRWGEFFGVWFNASVAAVVCDTTFSPFHLGWNNNVYWTLIGAYFIYDFVLRKD